MGKKWTKADKWLLVALTGGLVMHLLLALQYPYLYDEFFYTSIPYRLLQGDSLFLQEWHMSQLSSLFTFLPVWIWTVLVGSADGLILFLRCLYLVVHLVLSLMVYRRFRHHGLWAVAAVLLYFTQSPYRILAFSYNSLLAIFTLLSGLCLLSISQHPTKWKAFLTGLCLGGCCVCNPMFSAAYVAYLVAGMFCLRSPRCQEKLTAITPGHFFGKESMVFSSLGVGSLALLTLLFFFLTGGSLAGLFANLPSVFQSSEYGLTLTSLWEKVKSSYAFWGIIHLRMPYLPPLLYLVMLLDRKRTAHAHRCVYLLLAFCLGMVQIAGILLCAAIGYEISNSMFFSLPLLTLTTTCYILTQKKNRQLFFFMWLPCAVSSCIHFLAANTMLTALGMIFATANIAGVLFAGDLAREMAAHRAAVAALSPPVKRLPLRLGRRMICAGLCLQLLFHLIVGAWDQLSFENTHTISAGPCAGLMVSESNYQQHHDLLRDLDHLQAISQPDDPLLVISYDCWIYLYAQRPIATYTTWFTGNIQTHLLRAYYRANPEKIPRYIYVDMRYYNIQQTALPVLETLFEYSVQELSQGVLLTVEAYRSE